MRAPIAAAASVLAAIALLTLLVVVAGYTLFGPLPAAGTNAMRDARTPVTRRPLIIDSSSCQVTRDVDNHRLMAARSARSPVPSSSDPTANRPP
jgi:hypothetical protein